MKKAYIVTFQNAYNYGAILQCYALQTIINRFIKDTHVLNYDNKIISDPYKSILFPKEKFILKYKALFSSLLYHSKLKARNKNFEKCINDNLKLTKKMTKEEIINSNFGKSTFLITGSDQVWNTRLVHGVDDVYFLNFSKQSKKISYAASIGTNDLDPNYIGEIKERINSLDYISVREETAKKILKDLTDKEIDVIIDPTLMLNKNEWSNIIESERKIKNKYLLVYMPNKDVIKTAKYISKKEGLKIVNISKKRKFGLREINKFTCDPLEFIQLIRDAEYIVTSSFHGTAFSIIFNKKFWVFPPQKLSSRIENLLKKLKISNRNLNLEKNLFDNFDYNMEIDYINVNKILLNEQEKTKKILERILK